MAFHDETPLRQEEYQAMAEELRQKTEENRKLRAQLEKKRPINWNRIFQIVKTVGILALGALGITLAIMTTANVIEWHHKKETQEKSVYPKFEQKYPCYFVRHNVNWPDKGDEEFQKWHVYKANSSCDNRIISLDSERENSEPTFDTKIEAWKWAAEEHLLEMCK